MLLAEAIPPSGPQGGLASAEHGRVQVSGLLQHRLSVDSSHQGRARGAASTSHFPAGPGAGVQGPAPLLGTIRAERWKERAGYDLTALICFCTWRNRERNKMEITVQSWTDGCEEKSVKEKYRRQ